MVFTKGLLQLLFLEFVEHLVYFNKYSLDKYYSLHFWNPLVGLVSSFIDNSSVIRVLGLLKDLLPEHVWGKLSNKCSAH